MFRSISSFIEHQKYLSYKRKQKKMKNFKTVDLVPGTIIEWYKGTSTIVKLTVSFTQVIHSGKEKLDLKPEPTYLLNTRYQFDDELDVISESDILRVVGYDPNYLDTLPPCPNQEGVEGKCYIFDKYGDRTGCLGCIYSSTLKNGVFDKGDPLPGLTKMLEEGTLMENLMKDNKEDK